MMSEKLLSTEADDHIQELEAAITQIVQSWQNRTLTGSLLQAVYAPCGGGKTWLLQRWYKRWGGVLLDLHKSGHRSVIARIHSMQRSLENAPERHILFVDNVPNTEDELTKTFEEEILLSELSAGNLVIQAQRQVNQVCWGGAIPHPPVRLIPALSLEGVKAVRRKFGLVSAFNSTETILFSEQETLPGLVQAWCDGRNHNTSEVDILRDYLANWWQCHSEEIPQNFSSWLLPLAVLACQNTFDHRTMLAGLSDLQRNTLEASNIHFTENGLPFRLKMKRLELMRPDGAWYVPMRTVLRAWLSLEKPHVYSCLNSN
ncbi:MAG: hypothetical protein NZP74_04855 [Anaerolineales bacterium]|nr:hypothetical protein [Anaerolineales bacterium]MDW8276668.1 hypothetical protein [Anaerolineales bacterium]